MEKQKEYEFEPTDNRIIKSAVPSQLQSFHDNEKQSIYINIMIYDYFSFI